MNIKDKVLSIGNVPVSVMLKKIRANILRRKTFKPITMNGRNYLLERMHPKAHYKLMVMLAHLEYKQKSHLKRYARWVKLGKPKRLKTVFNINMGEPSEPTRM